MTVSPWRRRLVALMAAWLGLAVGNASAADTGSRVRVFDNEYVTVERITLAPGEGLAKHAGPKRIVYSLSDYTIAWTEDGKEESRTWREGDVHAHEALDHAVENTGNTVAEYLVVARTSKALPDATAGADASDIAGGYGALLGEFDGARVLRVALPPGARQPLHGGRARLVYALNDHRVLFATEDGDQREVAHRAGEVHWHEAGRHAVENAGEETARYVLFAFN